MPHDLDPFSAPISKRRPLLGITMLLVEDSRFASEAVRLMTLKSGARLRRADCMRSAHKHLAMYRPDLVIVDIGLPDGSGLDLIEELSDQHYPILAMSGSTDDSTRATALAAGANGFLPKPIGNMKQFQSVILASIRGTDTMPGFAPSIVEAGPDLDQQALVEDLDHIQEVLSEALPQKDEGRVEYCAQFVASIARTARDSELLDGTSAFFRGREQGSAVLRDGETILELVKKKLAAMPRGVADDKDVA